MDTLLRECSDKKIIKLAEKTLRNSVYRSIRAKSMVTTVHCKHLNDIFDVTDVYERKTAFEKIRDLWIRNFGGQMRKTCQVIKPWCCEPKFFQPMPNLSSKARARASKV